MSWEIRANLGISTEPAGGNWNNILSGTGSVANCVDFITGLATGIGLGYDSSFPGGTPFQNSGYNGLGVGDLSWCNDISALSDGNPQATVGTWSKLNLTGLTIGETITVKAASSTTASGRVTSWRVNGGISQDLASYDATNSHANNSSQVVFQFVATATIATIEYTRSAASSGTAYASAILITNAAPAPSISDIVINASTIDGYGSGMSGLTAVGMSAGGFDYSATSGITSGSTSFSVARPANLPYSGVLNVTATGPTGTSSAFQATIPATAGKSVTIAAGTLNTGSGSVFTSSNVDGDQAKYDTTSANSGAVTIDQSGPFSLVYSGAEPPTDSFTYAIWNSQTGVAGSTQTASVVNASFQLAVTSVGVPSAGTYTLGQNLDFTANLNANGTVSGTPRIPLVIGTATRYADYVSGSGTGASLFRYVIRAGDNDSDGIVVGSAIDPNGGSIVDVNGNALDYTLNGVGDTSAVLVNTTDITPDAFSFTSVTGANLGQTYASNAITITGVTAGANVPVSVTGGQYERSTDGGASWSAPSSASINAQLNDQFRIPLTASTAYSDPKSVTLDANGVSAIFTVTTKADTVAPVIGISGHTVLATETAATVYGTCNDSTATLSLVVNGTTYHPAPSGGFWSQSVPVPTVGGSPYTMTLDAVDPAGNASIQKTATLKVVDKIISKCPGRAWRWGFGRGFGI